MVERTRIAFFICAVGSPKGKYGGMDKDVIRRIATNVSAMSSGGFRTTHYQITTNDNRKHRLTK